MADRHTDNTHADGHPYRGMNRQQGAGEAGGQKIRQAHNETNMSTKSFTGRQADAFTGSEAG
eukprot:6192159-Pleurochrysis_carterae.AAC.2